MVGKNSGYSNSELKLPDLENPSKNWTKSSPDFKWLLKSRPFTNQTTVYHSKSGKTHSTENVTERLVFVLSTIPSFIKITFNHRHLHKRGTAHRYLLIENCRVIIVIVSLILNLFQRPWNYYCCCC